MTMYADQLLNRDKGGNHGMEGMGRRRRTDPEALLLFLSPAATRIWLEWLWPIEPPGIDEPDHGVTQSDELWYGCPGR